MEQFFKPKPVYIGKRIDFPDSLSDRMTQQDRIIVFLAGEDTKGYQPMDWVEEHILKPLRPRTTREKKSGRYK